MEEEDSGSGSVTIGLVSRTAPGSVERSYKQKDSVIKNCCPTSHIQSQLHVAIPR